MFEILVWLTVCVVVLGIAYLALVITHKQEH